MYFLFFFRNVRRFYEINAKKVLKLFFFYPLIIITIIIILTFCFLLDKTSSYCLRPKLQITSRRDKLIELGKLLGFVCP